MRAPAPHPTTPRESETDPRGPPPRGKTCAPRAPQPGKTCAPERARAARDAAMRSICRLIRSRGDGGPDVR